MDDFSQNPFHYLNNHLGSPIRLMGEQEETLAYDEFGVPTVESTQNGKGTLNNPFGFTGYQFDDVSGLYFAQARYYEPTNARFVSEDPIKDMRNWYAYCNGNPMRFIDPWGLSQITDREYFSWGNPDVDITYYDEFNKLRNDLEWYTRAKSIYNTSGSLGGVLAYDETITQVSEQLNVPKSMIQAVMFRELICLGADDTIDVLVWIGICTDSSTGLGQISAATAMKAYNPDNLSTSEMWKLLQNPEKNIEYVARVLLYEAKMQGIYDLSSLSEEQRINIFGAYNAGNNYATKGARYGNATESYFDVFERLNQSMSNDCN